MSGRLVLTGFVLVGACAHGASDEASTGTFTSTASTTDNEDSGSTPIPPPRDDCSMVVETCNGKDDNCDGVIDEGFDKDGDGWSTCAVDEQAPDCDDANSAIHPGAPERCNEKDDDCNGQVDEVPADLRGSLAPVNDHWVFAGGATVSASGWAQLTPDLTWQAGALWWDASYRFDAFDMSATLWIQAKLANAADGVAFAWVPGNTVGKVGLNAWGYGVRGLRGYAIAIDTYMNAGEPAAPFLVVLDATAGKHLHRTAIPEVRNGQNHTLRVKLDGGKVSVWLDAVSYINEFAIPSYTPFDGHWGFTAGTGGLSATHWVRDVKMSFPNGQGCVP